MKNRSCYICTGIKGNMKHLSLTFVSVSKPYANRYIIFRDMACYILYSPFSLYHPGSLDVIFNMCFDTVTERFYVTGLYFLQFIFNQPRWFNQNKT